MQFRMKAFFTFFILCGLLFVASAGGGHSKRHHRHAIGPQHKSGIYTRNPMNPSKPRGIPGVSAQAPAPRSGQTLASFSASTSTSGDYTCGPGKPCENGSCCGKDGWCGYSPKYCGKGCQSNCDAKAECGEFAAKKGAECPLKVCCSEFGFCGTTEDFCKKGCQSNCKQPKPKVEATNVRKIVIGYYEGWSKNRPCGQMLPEDIPVHSLTHLIFSFAFISPGTFRIQNMPGVQPSMFGRVTDLKMRNPSLKVLIALGGWTHNDPGPYQKVFSDLASSAANRKLFIKNLLGFMTEYGFDGADIDWEYPGADDRGGVPSDGENFTKLLREMKKEFGNQYLLTFTAPTSYWYLRHFDIKKSVEAVDWMNLMSYDLHGIWDRENPIGNQVLGHTNLTEIDLALDLFWRNDVKPSQIVLGFGFYGRSFILQDSSCWKPGCAFRDPGEKGRCTGEAGILSYQEIKDILSLSKAKAYFDKRAAVKYLTYGQNNWISFDDPETIEMKVDFASKMGLKGVMNWAVDLDEHKGELIKALSGGRIEDDDILQPVKDQSDAISHTTDDPTKCYITDCQTMCAKGYNTVGRCNTDKDGRNRCDTKNSFKARSICCPSYSGPTAEQCRWDDSRSSIRKQDCSGKCKVGEILIVNDSFGWEGGLFDGKYSDQCWRGAKSFCCKAGNMERYLDICTWSKCGGSCPSDKPHVLTKDTGGPSSNERCYSGPGGSTAEYRSLCCPKKDSFKNCKWESAKYCSSTCSPGQITLDLDQDGDTAGAHCHNGREKAFCCDPPGGLDRPFAPFNLENLFPKEYLPPADAIPQYDLVSFGGIYDGERREDPNVSGVAFLLLAGSTSAVTSMTKRDNPGITFLDCPSDILEKPNHEEQVARVVCTDFDVDSCFRVRENGVLGTIVQMPDDCGGPSWSRAISLTISKNQTVPIDIENQSPTSTVFDFAFDYNIGLVRRDAGKISIRMDYSNVPGYWKAVVDSSGNQKRDLPTLVNRFFGSSEEWYKKFEKLYPTNGIDFNTKLDKLVYHKGQMCSIANEDVGESLSIAMEGETKGKAFYGFSLIATWDPDSTVEIHQAAGFFRAAGETDAIFKIGGAGVLNTAESLQGSVISKTVGPSSLQGHSLYKGWAFFSVYQEDTVSLETRDGRGGAVPFSGYAEGRLKSDWGRVNINFPAGAGDTPDHGSGEGQRNADQVSRSKENRLDALEKATPGSIEVSSTTRIGLKVGMEFSRPYGSAIKGELPDMSISHRAYMRWNIENNGDKSCLSTSLGTNMKSHLSNGKYAGWKDKEARNFVYDLASTGAKECFAGGSARKIRRADHIQPDVMAGIEPLVERQVGEDPWDPLEGIPLPGDNLMDKGWNKLLAFLRCNGCGSCTGENTVLEPCCGCSCLPCKYGWGLYSDRSDPISGPQSRTKRDAIGNFTTASSIGTRVEDDNPELQRRATRLSRTRKDIKVCKRVVKSDLYPSFPEDGDSSFFDREDKSKQVPRYFHNSSALCTSWAVAKATTMDQVWDKDEGEITNQDYETEHILEAQTISRFLDGYLRHDSANKRSCDWLRSWLLAANVLPTNRLPVVNLMGKELGSSDHQDRLTVFLRSSNGLKGRLASAKTIIAQSKWDQMSAGDEQLTFLKEYGMVFAYMNIQGVWDGFCATYNGIRDVLKDFDDWYTQNQEPIDLAGEWKTFVKEELSRMAKTGRKDIIGLANTRKPVGGFWHLWWAAKWFVVTSDTRFSPLAHVKLDKPCANLQ